MAPPLQISRCEAVTPLTCSRSFSPSISRFVKKGGRLNRWRSGGSRPDLPALFHRWAPLVPSQLEVFVVSSTVVLPDFLREIISSRPSVRELFTITGCFCHFGNRPVVHSGCLHKLRPPVSPTDRRDAADFLLLSPQLFSTVCSSHTHRQFLVAALTRLFL